MIEKKKIGDLKIKITTGQIMSRVKANEDRNDEVIEVRKVVIPKSITGDGSLLLEEMPEEKLKIVADEKRLTQKGDIVLKLSTPYDAGMVDEATSGCLVPSFCAIVKNEDNIDNDYLLAFLNSDYCKKQLESQVTGLTMTVLSVGKVKEVEIPLPTTEKQIEVGQAFHDAQKRLRLLRQIEELEQKRNDAMFYKIEKEDHPNA